MNRNRQLFSSIMIASFLLIGCGQTGKQIQTADQSMDISDIEYISTVASEECFICGNRHEKDSIGVVYWNQSTIFDTEIRTYGDNGNETYKNESTRISSFQDMIGSIVIQSMSARHISRVSIDYSSKDQMNLDSLQNMLCRDCLDKVMDFFKDQNDHGNENRSGTTGFCLIDFKTKELYPLSDPYRGYFIRDYAVSFSINEKTDADNLYTGNGTIDLLIFYAPIQTSSNSAAKRPDTS